MQSAHILAAIILCITQHCISSENQTVSNNVTKSESKDSKLIFNLDGNVTKSLDNANPAEDHTQAQRNTSADGEQKNKETHGVKPGEFMINLRVLREVKSEQFSLWHSYLFFCQSD